MRRLGRRQPRRRCARCVRATTATPHLALQMLIYPGDRLGGHVPSMETNGTGNFLTKETMQWFRNELPRRRRTTVDGDPTCRRSTPTSPASARVGDDHIHDPLRDEGDRLRREAARRRRADHPHARRRRVPRVLRPDQPVATSRRRRWPTPLTRSRRSASASYSSSSSASIRSHNATTRGARRLRTRRDRVPRAARRGRCAVRTCRRGRT